MDDPGQERLDLGLFDLDAIDPDDPFEIDGGNGPHLAKHEGCDPELLRSMWLALSERRFFPAARGDAHWLLVVCLGGEVFVAALAPARSGTTTKCRPIGLRHAPQFLVDLYFDSF